MFGETMYNLFMAERKISHNSFSKSEALRFGWVQTKKNFWFLLGIFVIPVVINSVFSVYYPPMLEKHNALMSAFGVLLMIASWIISIQFSYATFALYFKVADKKKASLNDLFAYFKAGLLFRYIVLWILLELIVLAGFLLLIIPGIYFGLKFWFAPYIFVDKNTGIIESFKESAKLTKGVKWQLFLLGVLQLLIQIGTFFIFIIGLYAIGVPVNYLSDIYVYRKLSAKK